VVELIHTATLLHDDVVDESTLRRGRPTANENFGNPASVLVGDFLHTRSFQMMVECRQYAHPAGAVGCHQHHCRRRSAAADQHPRRVAERSRLSACDPLQDRQAVRSQRPDCRHPRRASPEQEAASVTYGQALGTAFQIIDDVLDYDGDAAEMGKNLGDDLREGKCTLPLIIAMQRGTAEQPP
jgi:octaprenyl-diphosphate synthase